MLRKKPVLIVSLIVGLFLCAASHARADTAFTVSLDTSQLSTLYPGITTFALDFQLNDGSGTSDGNNTATLSNFSLGGGSPSGIPDLFGGASGDLSTTVSLTDNSFLNEFTQGFTPGTLLSFDVNLTTNVDAGPFPDWFSFALTEPGFSFFDVYAQVNIDSANPPVQAITHNGLTPVVQNAQAVPEPVTLSLLLLGFAGMALTRRLQRPADESRTSAHC